MTRKRNRVNFYVELKLKHTNMKEIFNELKMNYKEDPKAFLADVGCAMLIFAFMWFVLWFAGTFCYDM